MNLELITQKVADEAQSLRSRLLWESGANIDLPPINGKPCRAVPIDLEVLIEALESCDSPEGLKQLREQYSTDFLNYVWVYSLGTATQNRIKPWMSKSTPNTSRLRIKRY